MTVASIQLHNGDTVSVEVGGDDGNVTQADIDEALRRLETEMNAANHPGTEYIDHNARIRISERGVTVERSAETLLRNGAVQLFGNNPMRTTSTGTLSDNPAMWRPTGFEVAADGTRYTIYREVDRWDAAAGRMVEGRTVRVNVGGGRYLQVPPSSADADPTWRVGTTDDHIPRLSFLPATEIDGLRPFDLSRINDRGTGTGADVRVDVAAPDAANPGPRVSRDWVYEGTVTENNIQYYYWHDPRDPNSVARTRVSNPAGTAETGRRMRYRAEGETEPSLHVSMWVCPDGRALVPTTGTPPEPNGIYTERAVSPSADPLTLRLPNGTQTFTLTPLQQTVHVVNGQPVLFDEYTASAGTGSPAMTFRRRHGETAGWETGSGANWTAIPATAIVAQAALPVVTLGTGANAPTVTLTPDNPPTSGNFDMFTGSISGDSTVLHFRRRRGVVGATIEVRQGSGYVPVTDYGNPAARPRVVGGVGGRSAPRPGPRIVY
ncbi:MAG TPA: hypothetical protein VFX30_00775 [bacterium]|nr:hypothetical protein [bacterium]